MLEFSIYYIISPLSGAIIGYFTNWVAIKMLFRPHNEKYLFGARLPFTPGLIPKRRGILAKKVGQTITEHLLTDETMTASLCSDEVKQSIEGILDGFIIKTKAYDRTIGSVLFKQDFSEQSINEVTRKVSDYFFSDAFLELAGKFERGIIDSEKKIGELIPAELSANVTSYISGNGEKISKGILDILESDFFDAQIKPVLLKLIDQNVKGLATLFVIPEKTYANFFQAVTDYLKNPENYDTVTGKIIEVYDKLSNTNIKEVVGIISKNNEKPLTSLLIKERGNDDELAASIRKAIKEQVTDKAALSVLSMRVCDIASKIDVKYFNRIKASIMNRYDAAVKKQLPSLLMAIDISTLIEAKINEFEVKEAEEIIISVVDRELKAITYLGGFLGFFIGLVPPLLQSLGLQ